MKVFLLLLAHSAFVTAVIFPGPCPDIETIDSSFECSTHITSGSYRVAAYLSVDGTTLNIFHNPFDSINCMDFIFTCSYAYSYSRNIQIRLNCYPTMAGNKTSGIVTQCLPITFNGYDFKSYNQVTNFGLGLQLLCKDKLVVYSSTLIFGSQKEFLGIFGCRNLNDGTHDEGAWVLASTAKDLPSNSQEKLEDFLHAVSNMSASTSDFSVNDFNSEYSCTCPKCSYTMECPVDKAEEEPVYNYYDGVNYADYPQYDDNSENSYYTYPNYGTDAPAYYYYYDTNGDYNNGPIVTDSTQEPMLSTIETTRQEPITTIIETTTDTVFNQHFTESFLRETTVIDISTTETSFSKDVTFVTEKNEVKVENATEDIETYHGNHNETLEDQ